MAPQLAAATAFVAQPDLGAAGVDPPGAQAFAVDRDLDRGLAAAGELRPADPRRELAVAVPGGGDVDARGAERGVADHEADVRRPPRRDVDPHQAARLALPRAEIEQAIRDRLRALEDLRRDIELRHRRFVELIAEAVDQIGR